MGRGLSGFELWLKSQLLLWGPLAPSAWLGLALFSWWCPLPFYVGNVSLPWAFLQPAPPRPHYPSSAESRRLPIPSGLSLGQRLSLPIPPSSSHLLPCLALVWNPLSSGMWSEGTGPSLTPVLFQMRRSGPEMGGSFSGSQVTWWVMDSASHGSPDHYCCFPLHQAAFSEPM